VNPIHPTQAASQPIASPNLSEPKASSQQDEPRVESATSTAFSRKRERDEPAAKDLSHKTVKKKLPKRVLRELSN
jgi:hypothetical protein